MQSLILIQLPMIQAANSITARSQIASIFLFVSAYLHGCESFCEWAIKAVKVEVSNKSPLSIVLCVFLRLRFSTFVAGISALSFWREKRRIIKNSRKESLKVGELEQQAINYWDYLLSSVERRGRCRHRQDEDAQQ